jgi:hypothetical protein
MVTSFSVDCLSVIGNAVNLLPEDKVKRFARGIVMVDGMAIWGCLCVQ